MIDEKNNSFVDTLKVVKDISLAITFSIYYSGFLFVNAKYSVFISDMSHLDIISASLPTTLDLYLRNGIYVCCALLICYVVSMFFYSNARVNGIKMNKKKKVVNLKSPGDGSLRKGIELIPLAIFPPITITFFQYNFFIIHTTFAIVFIYLFIWLFRVNSHIINEVVKENVMIDEIINSGEHQQNQIESLINGSAFRKFDFTLFRRKIVKGINAYYFLVFVVFLSIFIFEYGAFLQTERIFRISDGGGTYKVANVYYDNSSSYQQYYVLDVSRDVLIGYKDKKAVIIPLPKLAKLEIKSVKIKKGIKKLDDSQLGTLKVEQQEIVRIISEYYRMRIVDQDSSKLLNIITDNHYSKNYRRYSLEAIEARWRANNEYNNHPINEYIGIELSVPELIELDTYEVYVYEIWNRCDDSMRYVMLKENGDWKIDTAESNVYSIGFD